jgi:GAF domain-containing protein
MEQQIIEPGRHTLVGKTALECSTVHIPDVLTDADYTWGESIRRGGFRAMLGIPLLREGVPIGVIAACRPLPKPFSANQIELVSTFADQAVIAIENVRLFDEVKARTEDLTESLQQQTATADVLKVISRSTLGSKPDLEAALETLLESAIRLCGAMRGHVYRCEGEFLRFAAASGAWPGFRDWLEQNPLRLDRGSFAGRAALERQVCHTEDVLADPEFRNQALLQYQSFRSLLAVPMLRDGEPLGVIVILKSKVEPFTAKQIELVSTFADQAVIAFENVRLFEEVTARTEDLRESLQQQTATADVLKVISRSKFDLQPVLDTLVHTAAQLCETDHAFIFRRDGDGIHRLAANYGFSAEYEQWIRDNPPSMTRGSTTGRTALDRKIVHITDVLADPEYQATQHQSRGGYRTVLGVPLLRGGEAVGVFTLARPVVKPFTEKQIELITTFADQAVIAIENVRLFDDLQARTRDLAESLEQQTAT